LSRYVLYGILAMSLAFLWGRAGMLSFGHAAFFGFGAYTMAAILLGRIDIGIANPWLALALAVAATAAFGLVLGVFLFWGGGIRGPHLALVTLAVAVVLEQAVRGWYALGADNGMSGVPPLPLGDDPWNPRPAFYVALLAAMAVYALLDALLASRFGAVLTALRTNPDRLPYFGYSVIAYRVAAFVLGAAVAGFAGALFVTTDSFASPSLIGFALSAEVVIWVALGGRSVLLAAFLSAIVVRLAEAYLSETLGPWWLLALGVLLMVSVVALPQGLLATPLQRLARSLARVPRE
jgi:branched-chain amino acid transport system permease protein/urea transport system permease protein